MIIIIIMIIMTHAQVTAITIDNGKRSKRLLTVIPGLERFSYFCHFIQILKSFITLSFICSTTVDDQIMTRNFADGWSNGTVLLTAGQVLANYYDNQIFLIIMKIGK